MMKSKLSWMTDKEKQQTVSNNAMMPIGRQPVSSESDMPALIVDNYLATLSQASRDRWNTRRT